MSFVRKYRHLILILLAVVCFYPFLVNGHASAVSYSQDELIDDSVFLDSNSMNANQIQAFLTGIGSSLANYTTVETVSYYPNYNHTVSAAELIFDAGEVYGVNPQAIMATMQKEESLITDPSPAASQINFAMGYGCADSTGCSQYAGLFNQIDNGTWQLRFNYERAAGNNSWWNSSITYPCANPSNYYKPGLFPGNNVTFYDDHGTAYDTFTINNASTASLYCYTPHAYPGSSAEYYSGSYNFVVAFDNWFGSTLGSLVRSSSDPTLYYDDGISKYLVGSMDMAAQYNLGLGDVRIVAQSDLNAVPLASSPDTPSLSYVVKSDGNNDNGTIYLINGGIRYPITSMTQYYNFGFTLNQLGYMPLNDLQRMPVGSDLSDFVSDPTGFVYEINSDVRNGIFDSNVLGSLDPSNNVTPVSSLVADSIPLGQAIFDGNSVLIGQDGSVWLVIGSTWYYISSMSLYSCLGLTSLPNVPFTSAQTTIGTQSNNISCFVSTTGGSDYIMDNGRKIPVNSGWGFTSFNQIGDAFINNVPTYTPTSTPLFRTQSNGALYSFVNGKKNQIINMTSFTGNGYVPNDIFTSQSDFLSTVPSGPLVLSSGMVVQDPSSDSLYVISGTGKLYISSMTEFAQFGFNPANIIPMDANTLSSYATIGTLSPLADVPTPTLFDSGIGWQALTSALQTDYGFNGSTPTYSSGVASSVTSSQQLTPYVKFNSSATLYYMVGGQKRPVYSMTTFTALGGTLSNLTILSDSAASLFPTGANE